MQGTPQLSTHLVQAAVAVCAQAADMELALAGVAEDDGALAKGAAQEVGLGAEHAAAALVVHFVHNLRRPRRGMGGKGRGGAG